MPPKAKLAAPIDRPLSRAYLREFSGWSTEYPPGASDPTSLRTMENVMVNRDGSLRVRPGLRYLSYTSAGLGMPAGRQLVGSHEVFFLNDGRKAYLFAVREADGSVGFRVARNVEGEFGYDGRPYEVLPLDNPQIGFLTSGGSVVPPLLGTTTYVKYLQIDNKIIALSDSGDSLRIFYVGDTKYARDVQSIDRPEFTVADKPIVYHPNGLSVSDPVTNPPNTNNTAGIETTKHLRASTSAEATVPYSIGYFYTFSNAVGESAASQVTVIKVRRPMQSWKWETSVLTTGTPVGAVSGEPTGVETDDPALVADQLAIYPSSGAFDAALAAGATHMNVYALMWSDQDVVPVEGVLVGSLALNLDMTYANAWVRHSPQPLDASKSAPLPTAANRRNYSESPTASQGIVAADRMVLVRDPNAAAVIRYSSNRAGENTNFTASSGGGFKTLTSGNLFIPACVKLWQNPQSVDTLTILCEGVDGYSTAYYMAPAQVSAQTDVVTIMGFEETTATPGTSSPYGCEVLNNALYHPLETELMKSTASNYNINHKTMTELISNMWGSLLNKRNIVSSQLDNRLYYIVHNRYGAALEGGCLGNEVWVCDTGVEGGSWSRWLVQGSSLRKIELGGRILMSIVRPDGIYCFDDELAVDEYVALGSRAVQSRPIPWKIETNTQGANRAHDAWAHLQQVSISLGNFLGTMRYGVRGWDVHSKPIDISKVTNDLNAGTGEESRFDLEDHLLVRRDMKEWFFYAESVADENTGEAMPSFGQITLVQYRYTPVSVNVGYEYGSVESFEYGGGGRVPNTDGVPVPVRDTRRP